MYPGGADTPGGVEVLCIPIPDEDFWAFSCSKSYAFVKEYRDYFWQFRVKRTGQPLIIRRFISYFIA